MCVTPQAYTTLTASLGDSMPQMIARVVAAGAILAVAPVVEPTDAAASPDAVIASLLSRTLVATPAELNAFIKKFGVDAVPRHLALRRPRQFSDGVLESWKHMREVCERATAALEASSRGPDLLAGFERHQAEERARVAAGATFALHQRLAAARAVDDTNEFRRVDSGAAGGAGLPSLLSPLAATLPHRISLAQQPRGPVRRPRTTTVGTASASAPADAGFNSPHVQRVRDAAPSLAASPFLHGGAPPSTREAASLSLPFAQHPHTLAAGQDADASRSRRVSPGGGDDAEWQQIMDAIDLHLRAASTAASGGGGGGGGGGAATGADANPFGPAAATGEVLRRAGATDDDGDAFGASEPDPHEPCARDPRPGAQARDAPAGGARAAAAGGVAADGAVGGGADDAPRPEERSSSQRVEFRHRRLSSVAKAGAAAAASRRGGTSRTRGTATAPNSSSGVTVVTVASSSSLPEAPAGTPAVHDRAAAMAAGAATAVAPEPGPVAPPNRARSRAGSSRAASMGRGVSESCPAPAVRRSAFADDMSKVLFQVSPSCKGNDRKLAISAIESLGASISVAAAYEPRATHLVCAAGPPERTEKYLAFRAANKKLVTLAMLLDSLEVGFLVAEDAYSPLRGNDELLAPVVDEAGRLRCATWRVAVFTSPSVGRGILAILAAGGCTCASLAPFTTRAEAESAAGAEWVDRMMRLNAERPLTHVLVELDHSQSVATNGYVPPPFRDLGVSFSLELIFVLFCMPPAMHASQMAAIKNQMVYKDS